MLPKYDLNILYQAALALGKDRKWLPGNLSQVQSGSEPTISPYYDSIPIPKPPQPP